ncbi:MAG: hypothetical protein KAJ24_02570, partial [Candidatus Aenigmarchaeota archaeon]|nr:hypothetical protein [Candidatus Aenigmarchaeota archaeon]
AKQIYEAQLALEESGGNADYSLVDEKIDELGELKKRAFRALDELKALEFAINQTEGINKTPVLQIYNMSKTEFEAERYEECLKQIDNTYEKISEMQAIETKVKAFYEATSRNIITFLKQNRNKIIFIMAVIFTAAALGRTRIECWIIRRKIRNLNTRWTSVRKLVAETQGEYFEGKKLSETTYHIRIKKYGEIMRDIKRQIPLLNEELAMKMKKR